MIIRSQDKAFIINFEKVDTVCLGGIEGKSVITFTYAQVVTLGEYSTEEKAIKVLDMIQQRYLESSEVSMGGISMKCIPRAMAFQMPQDSEV